MINKGAIYLIAKDFDESLEFYKDLLEKDVCAQNEKRFAIFDIGGFSLAIMNSIYDIQNPDKVITMGLRYDEYDNFYEIALKNNHGKVVINLSSNDLNGDYERLKNAGIGKNLTKIRYINAKNPYYYFSLKDPDDNIIEITGMFNSEKYKLEFID